MRFMLATSLSCLALIETAHASEPDDQACFHTCYMQSCHALPAGSSVKQLCLASCARECGDSTIIAFIHKRGFAPISNPSD